MVVYTSVDVSCIRASLLRRSSRMGPQSELAPQACPYPPAVLVALRETASNFPGLEVAGNQSHKTQSPRLVSHTPGTA